MRRVHQSRSLPPSLLLLIGLSLTVMATPTRAQDHLWWDGFDLPPTGNGLDAKVTALGAFEGDLIASGDFTDAGGVAATRVARWNGSAWSPLGSGLDGAATVMTVYDGDLIVAGHFIEAGGQTVNRIARWDGSSWHALGTGMNDFVTALAVWNGQLIAGGKFTTAGGTTASYIASWNGTTWSPLGVGMSYRVETLIEFEGDLIAAGLFTEAGGATVNHVARWNGSTWSGVGGGTSAYVRALIVHDGLLVAAGGFLEAGGSPAAHIAAFDGASWSPLGYGIDDEVKRLAAYNGALIAAGSFLNAGSIPASRVARWDGVAWHALGSGVDDIVYALDVAGGDLYLGGEFVTAGGGSSHRIARWGDAGDDRHHVPGEYPTIQAAIDAAVSPDTVLIADGIYRGEGNRDISFDGKTITVRSESGVPEACIIDCEGEPGAPHRGFVFTGGPGPEGVLAGVTITHGYADEGAGIRIESASPTISNCILDGNTADGVGPGSYLGGGAYVAGGGPTFIDCIFAHNRAGSEGGGLSCENATPTVTSCTFAFDAAPGAGGIYVRGGTTTVTGTIIAFGTEGTAIGCHETEPTTITLDCCDLYGNAGGNWVGCVASQFGYGHDNIDRNPRFCDPLSGDFGLAENSPCLPGAQPHGVQCDLIGARPQGCDPLCTTHYVDPAGDDIYPFCSPTGAASSISRALVAAGDGDTVMIAAGDYSLEDILVPHNVTIAGLIPSGRSARPRIGHVTYPGPHSGLYTDLRYYSTLKNLDMLGLAVSDGGTYMIVEALDCEIEADATIVTGAEGFASGEVITLERCSIAGDAFLHSLDHPWTVRVRQCDLEGRLTTRSGGTSPSVNEVFETTADVIDVATGLATVADCSCRSTLQVGAEGISISRCDAPLITANSNLDYVSLTDCVADRMVASSDGDLYVTSCVVGAGGMSTEAPWTTTIESCTVVGPGDTGLDVYSNGGVILTRSLVVGFDTGVALDLAGSATAGCNDVWDCATPWAGIPDPTGANGNFSADPRFCSIGAGNYQLASDSPCLPGNHPDGYDCGGVIGALGEGCPPAIDPAFADVTQGPLGETGTSFGVAWGDYDGDGDLDLYVANHGPNRLLRNDGSDPDPMFVDVATGPAADPGYGFGVVWGDYDNDGDLDLFLANVSSENRLLRNDGGAGLAQVVTGVLEDPGHNEGVGWSDYDLDGDLDLYVVNSSGDGRLYRNDGSDAFADLGPLTTTVASEGAAWGDYDLDGDPDLYVTDLTGPDHLLRNDNGTFVDVTGGPLGSVLGDRDVEWGDYDGDGDPDLLLSGNPESRLFRNDQPGGGFVDVSGASFAIPTTDVAWVDYDNDGDLDAYLSGYGSVSRLLRNEDGAFVDATSGAIGQASGNLGAAWGDYDDDGDLDVFIATDELSANRLLRNDTPSEHHWIEIDLEGTISNRAGIGARVEVVSESLSQTREISGSSGFLSQNAMTAHIGLGTRSAAETIIVHWPSGVMDIVEAIPADRRIRIVEGSGLVGTPAAAPPARFALHPAWPNPFTPRTTIAFDVASAVPVQLRVYDVGGRLVRTLVSDGTHAPGQHLAIWKGRDDAGHVVAPGLYFCRLDAGVFSQTRRLILIR